MPQAVGRAEGRALPRMAVCRAPLRPFPLGGADILGPGVPAGTHLGRSPAPGIAAAARLSEGRAGRARPALPAPRLPSGRRPPFRAPQPTGGRSGRHAGTGRPRPRGPLPRPAGGGAALPGAPPAPHGSARLGAGEEWPG